MKKARVHTLQRVLKDECKLQGIKYTKGMLRKAKKAFHEDTEVKRAVLNKNKP